MEAFSIEFLAIIVEKHCQGSHMHQGALSGTRAR